MSKFWDIATELYPLVTRYDASIEEDCEILELALIHQFNEGHECGTQHGLNAAELVLMPFDKEAADEVKKYAENRTLLLELLNK